MAPSCFDPARFPPLGLEGRVHLLAEGRFIAEFIAEETESGPNTLPASTLPPRPGSDVPTGGSGVSAMSRGGRRLRCHYPSIKVIARDRASIYTEAIAQGASQAQRTHYSKSQYRECGPG